MIFNSNVELDTNIYNTPFPLRNMILDCYSNGFWSLIISTNHSIHFRYLSNAIKSNGGCFSLFKYNHLPHLHIVTHRHSLKIIKYSNRDYYKPGCWLFKPTHKTSCYFSALIQPTHFRSTPSSLVFEINSGNQDTDIWARWWDSNVGCHMLKLDITWKLAFDILYHWT